MKKEEFIALGIDPKLAEKAAEESKKELAEYVPKSKLDEVNESKKQLETTVNDYKTQLETLKAAAGNNDTLKQQIADLQAENQKKDVDYQNQLKELQMTNAIKLVIADSAQDSDLVAGLIDKTKLILGDDGKVTVLDEQVNQYQGGSIAYNPKNWSL
ncbi:MAG: phage scaffolding protein [Eubacteriales bacterium]|nr:phage scaffolding protein [Eubacteriales bacterium]